MKHKLREQVSEKELNADISNWWIPTREGLHALCRAAGFRKVKTIVGPIEGVERYRLVVHASV